MLELQGTKELGYSEVVGGIFYSQQKRDFRHSFTSRVDILGLGTRQKYHWHLSFKKKVVVSSYRFFFSLFILLMRNKNPAWTKPSLSLVLFRDLIAILVTFNEFNSSAYFAAWIWDWREQRNVSSAFYCRAWPTIFSFGEEKLMLDLPKSFKCNRPRAEP